MGALYDEKIIIAAAAVLCAVTVCFAGKFKPEPYEEPSSPGETVYTAKQAVIDASNTEKGYISARYTGDSGVKLKVMITYPEGNKYTYNLNDDGKYDYFPLSGGDGAYKVGIYKNISGSRYATLVSARIDTVLNDEFEPFCAQINM